MSITQDFTIEKRPGVDWNVYYMETDGTRQTMTVFGARDVEEALRDARNSFDPGDEPLFVAVIQVGIDLTLYQE